MTTNAVPRSWDRQVGRMEEGRGKPQATTTRMDFPSSRRCKRSSGSSWKGERARSRSWWSTTRKESPLKISRPRKSFLELRTVSPAISSYNSRPDVGEADETETGGYHSCCWDVIRGFAGV